MTLEWETDPALPCHNCGAPCWVGYPITRPSGDVVLCTVCPACWAVNDFVNGQPARVVLIPLPFGRSIEIRAPSTRSSPTGA